MENIYVWKREAYWTDGICSNGGFHQKNSYGFSEPTTFADIGKSHSIKELVAKLVIRLKDHDKENHDNFGKDFLIKGCSNLPTNKIGIEIGYGSDPRVVYLKKPLDNKEISDLVTELIKNMNNF